LAIREFIRTGILTLVLAATAGAAHAHRPAGPEGQYCGRMESGDELVEAITTFRKGADGRISGHYRFRDGRKFEPGRLSEAFPILGGRMKLRWKDVYGEGDFDVGFTPDFSAFEGHWGMTGEKPEYRWTGRRCQGEIS